MAMFRLSNIEFDAGEYTHERVLWIDVLVRGDRIFSEPIKLDNQPRGKNIVELVRRSETTLEAIFNSQLHSSQTFNVYSVDVILRDQDHKAIASAFNVSKLYE